MSRSSGVEWSEGKDQLGIWHYTVGYHTESILKDKMLKPSTEGVPPGERPVVWFTTNPGWEPTATKAMIENGRRVSLTKERTEEECGGLFRIEVVPEAAP